MRLAGNCGHSEPTWGEALTGIVVSAALLVGGALLILLIAMRS
jgi:hypothetical protein